MGLSEAYCPGEQDENDYCKERMSIVSVDNHKKSTMYSMTERNDYDARVTVN